MLDTACEALRRSGHDVDVLDLEAIGFRAEMTIEEHRAYHGDRPVIDPLVAAHVAIVQRAEALVFVYPTWWSGLPAVLKGWLERVLVPGVGFLFDASGNVRPGLTHVRRLIGISTYGSPRRYVWLINDNGRRILMRAARLNTGLRTRRQWLALYSTDTSTPAQRRAFLDRVATRMARL